MDKLTTGFRRFFSAFPQAMACILAGLRDGLHPRLILQSLGIWAAVLLFWSLVFWFARAQVGEASLWVVQLAAHGGMAWLDDGAATGPAWLAGSAVTGLLAGTVALLAFVLLNLFTARMLVDAFLMGTIQGIVRKRYPTVESWPGGSWKAGLRNSVGPVVTVLLLALPLMLVPVLNVIALFFLFNYLNVRGLLPDALEDIASDEETRALIEGSRVEMAVLGVLMVPVVMIPPLTLFGPSVLGASVTHFGLQRLKARRRGALA